MFVTFTDLLVIFALFHFLLVFCVAAQQIIRLQVCHLRKLRVRNKKMHQKHPIAPNDATNWHKFSQSTETNKQGFTLATTYP